MMITCIDGIFGFGCPDESIVFITLTLLSRLKLATKAKVANKTANCTKMYI